MSKRKEQKVWDVIERVHEDALDAHGKDSWVGRHLDAWNRPRDSSTLETALARAIRAWASYADAHLEKFGTAIGNDRVLGPAWAQWGKALRTLLNGDLGRLDGGSLDAILLDGAAVHFINLEE